ncbi:hypothetical protein MMC25_003149 [Agyrium rufum]|nr:hypothetical protein [Agyrium rufum]
MEQLDPQLRDPGLSNAKHDRSHSSNVPEAIILPPLHTSAQGRIRSSVLHPAGKPHPYFAQSITPSLQSASISNRQANIPAHTSEQVHTTQSAGSSNGAIHASISTAIDLKRPRACEACRGLKVRCEPNPDVGPCRRCAKAGRHCIITQPTRKRQKKSDGRVAELERKIDALTATLQATKNNQSGSDEDSYDEGDSRDEGRKGSGDHRKRRRSSYGSADGLARHRKMHSITSPRHHDSSHAKDLAYITKLAPVPLLNPSLPGHEYADIVDRRIVDATTASNLFRYYKIKISKHLPIVVFNENTFAGEIRRTKPILFLALLCVASRSSHPDLQRILAKELSKTLAESIFIKEERSLELVQALLVSAIWHCPSDHQDAKAYQRVHLAAIIAICIGISRSKKPTKHQTLRMGQSKAGGTALDGSTDECRRTWLGCYIVCANFAHGFRQQTLISWDSYHTECLEALAKPSSNIQLDAGLCHWASTQRDFDALPRSAENRDIGQQYEKDIQQTVSSFQETYSQLSNSPPPNASLLLNIQALSLLAQRMSLRLDLTTEVLTESNTSTPPPPLSPAKLVSLNACLIFAQGVLSAFLNIEPADIRDLPTFHFFRVAYAMIFILRLELHLNLPEKELRKSILIQTPQVEGYFSQLFEVLREASKDDLCRPARNLLLSLSKLLTWHQRQRDGKTSKSSIRRQTPNPAQPLDMDQDTPRLGYRKLSTKLEHDGHAFQTISDRSILTSGSLNEGRKPHIETEGKVASPLLMAGLRDSNPLSVLSHVAIDGHHMMSDDTKYIQQRPLSLKEARRITLDGGDQRPYQPLDQVPGQQNSVRHSGSNPSPEYSSTPDVANSPYPPPYASTLAQSVSNYPRVSNDPSQEDPFIPSVEPQLDFMAQGSDLEEAIGLAFGADGDGSGMVNELFGDEDFWESLKAFQVDGNFDNGHLTNAQ